MKEELLKCVKSYLDNQAIFRMEKCGKITIIPKEHEEYSSVELSKEREDEIYNRMKSYVDGKSELISPEDMEKLLEAKHSER